MCGAIPSRLPSQYVFRAYRSVIFSPYTMATCRQTLLLFLLAPIFGLIPTRVSGVEIKSLRVPERVVNGSRASVVLDCDYSLQEPEGLVVKWFFNNNPDPVYQWIHNQKPQDLGVLKGKLNLDYVASEDDTKAYRALEILNPTTSLSGEYKCLVSTFQGEDSESKRMVIYVPERSLTMTLTNEEGKVTVRCVAEGVYPEPKLAIIAKKREAPVRTESLVETEGSGEGTAHASYGDRQIQPSVEMISKENVYDIIATVTYSDKDLETPTTFDCVLRIPEANYTVARSTLYYPASSSSSTFWPRPELYLLLLFHLLKL